MAMTPEAILKPMSNIEIERKFLVTPSLLPESVKTGGRRFVQGYFLGEPSVRIRVVDGGSENACAWLTIKGKGLVTRSEFEYEIPVDDAHGLLGLCAYSLDKIRHLVIVGEHTWEVDEFQGAHAGLWMAEVELDSEDEAFVLPDWVVTEVSTDPHFTNSALAKSGQVPSQA